MPIKPKLFLTLCHPAKSPTRLVSDLGKTSQPRPSEVPCSSLSLLFSLCSQPGGQP